jgi:beta-lactamase regulating signal transducer with metallopeptidase domain
MDVELILRTSALLLMAAVLARGLRRAAAATRHLVWHATIVLVLLAPAVARLAPSFDVGFVLPAATIAVPAADVAGGPSVAATHAARSSTGAGEERQATWRSNADPMVWHQNTSALSGWSSLSITATLLLACWFLLGWIASGISVWRGSEPAPRQWDLEAQAIAARLGLRRPVRTRRMVSGGSPHVAGLFRSVVMMPASASQWSREERQAAFVHELTHIRRHDRLTQALAHAACAIYWFNPLVWHAAAGMARERERACDDEVLRAGVKPSAYAALLLDLARAPRQAWRPATALSIVRPSAIEGRLVSILGDDARAARPRTRWLVTLAVAACAAVILGARPSASPASPRPLVKATPIMALDEGPAAPSLTAALTRALADASADVRERAALRLAFTPGDDVIEPLLSALRDRDPQVREKAAIGLAFRRDPRIIEPLLAAMADPDPQVREKAAIALGASGDPRAAGALRAAASDSDPQVREKAVAGLVLLDLRPDLRKP